MISKDELEYLAQISKINLSEDEAKNSLNNWTRQLNILIFLKNLLPMI